MKIEILCPACGNAYLLDESAIAASGGAVPCAACGAMIRVPATGAAGSSPPRPRPARRRAPPPAPSSESSPRADAPPKPAPKSAAKSASKPSAALPAPDAAAEQVVCPRCGLHFAPRPGRAAAAASDRPTVLVVEDMDYFREIARDALSERFEVRTASTVNEAIAALRAGDIDLVVLDLTLDGGEHGFRLLASMQPKPCPIVVFTAEDESELYEGRWDELRSLGADDLVLKGMNVGETLVRKVSDLLGLEPEDEGPMH